MPCATPFLQELIVSPMPPIVLQQPGKMLVFIQSHGISPRTCHNAALKSWEHPIYLPDMQAERAECTQGAMKGIGPTRTSSHGRAQRGTSSGALIPPACMASSIEGHFPPLSNFIELHISSVHWNTPRHNDLYNAVQRHVGKSIRVVSRRSMAYIPTPNSGSHARRSFGVSAHLALSNFFLRSLSVVVLAAFILVGCRGPSDLGKDPNWRASAGGITKDQVILVGVVHVTQGR